MKLEGVLGTKNLDSGTVKNDTKLGFPYNAADNFEFLCELPNGTHS